MDMIKPTTMWAIASVVSSILGWIVVLFSLLADYQNMAGATAGVGAGFFVLAVGCLSSTLCLLGIIFGMFGLRRIRRGKCAGRGIAWTGIALGGLPFVALLAWNIPGWGEELWTRLMGVEAKK
jgi:hypothetical protein